MRFRAGVFLLAASAFAGLGILGADTTPLEVAKGALESFRKDEDRKLTSMEFQKQTEAIPASAEIYLIQGYICYDCIRIVWSDGKATAQSVKMSRSWFYSPKEGYTCGQFEIPSADFRKAWEAAMMVRSAEMSDHSPKPRDWSGSGSFSSSSHEWTYFVRVSTGNDKLLLDWRVRGTRTSNGIQAFGDIQTRAISKLFVDLIPKEAAGTAFDLKSWGPFLTGILAGDEPAAKANPKRLDAKNELLMETSLRLLGQSGYAPALDVIAALEADASQPAPGPLKEQGLDWQSRILREAGYARRKIEFQERLEPEPAAETIHHFGRSINSDRDFVLWLRDEFFKQNPGAYFALLAADIQSPESGEDILRESIIDLKSRYPDKAAPLLQVVLSNPSSEVVADAALAVLEQDRNNEAALKALSRLAGDPGASIPSSAHWFDHFGRERALDYLASARSPVLEKYRWDVARVESQLERPWEDGRMINRLISSWSGLQNQPWADDKQTAAYRRTIAGTINRGTVDAFEALMKLHDTASAGRMAGILQELGVNCNKGLAWESDPSAKYPWIDKYEIERITADLKMLSK